MEDKEPKIEYKKNFVSFQRQIETLKSRGLIIEDEDFATRVLETVSYYRLRAYTYPFQDNNSNDHPFVKPVTFNKIISLYDFDCDIRKLLFSALEKIEIALRTQIIYHFEQTYGSHWQINPALFRDTKKFKQHLKSLNDEIRRSDETFIKHYAEKYATHSQPQPPSWMSLEVVSFGLLSKIYQNIKNGAEKQAIAAYFGLKKVETLENWMFCFSNLRNVCAHHSRVWNRRLTSLPHLPYNTRLPFLTKSEIETIYRNKIYAVICCLYYALKKITADNASFKKELTRLMESCPLKQDKEMGFPLGWQQQSLWNIK